MGDKMIDAFMNALLEMESEADIILQMGAIRAMIPQIAIMIGQGYKIYDIVHEMYDIIGRPNKTSNN